MQKDKLDFYYINKEYIEYLRRFDEKIPIKNRPYLKVFKYNNYIYMAPLFSAREKHKKYYMNNTFFRIYDYNNYYIGLIRFSNMIPVPEHCIKQANIDISDKLYQEYFYISKHKKQIMKKAQYTYDNYNKIGSICVNFKKVESIVKYY